MVEKTKHFPSKHRAEFIHWYSGQSYRELCSYNYGLRGEPLIKKVFKRVLKTSAVSFSSLFHSLFVWIWWKFGSLVKTSTETVFVSLSLSHYYCLLSFLIESSIYTKTNRGREKCYSIKTLWYWTTQEAALNKLYWNPTWITVCACGATKTSACLHIIFSPVDSCQPLIHPVSYSLIFLVWAAVNIQFYYIPALYTQFIQTVSSSQHFVFWHSLPFWQPLPCALLLPVFTAC